MPYSTVLSPRRASCRALLSAVGAALLLAAPAARAQLTNPAFDLELLRLDPSAEGSLVVGGGRLLSSGTLRLGLAGQYEYKPLVLQLSGVTPSLVNDRFMVHALAAYGLTDHLELSLEIPMIARQSGQNLAIYGFVPVEASGLSNPLLGGRFTLLGRDQPIAVALGLVVGIPFGSPQALGGSGGSGTSFTPSLQGSYRSGGVLTSAEVSTLIRATQSLDNRRIGSIFNGQISVGAAEGAFRPEVMARTGASFAKGVPGSGEFLGGLRHPLGHDGEIFALAGFGVGTLPGQPVFRGMLGFSWRPQTGAPPPPPPPAPMCKAPEPCPSCQLCPPPPPPPDPCSPGQKHTPEQCPALDDDGDGVPNSADKCPLEAGPAANQGCPLPDRDHDGVPDVDDFCPDEAGPADNNGCPVKDADKDGVPDIIDNCPNDPGPAENHGCPVEKKQLVFIEREKVSRYRSRLKLTAEVNFDTGKTTVPDSATEALNQLAEVLKAHAELKKLRVEGHTDNAGDEKANLALSTERAKAVEAYLVKRGVPRARLSAQGFGSQKPITSNDTDLGRAKNRRVELVAADEGVAQ